MTCPTKSTCDACGASGRVFVQHSIKIGARWVQWRECQACVKAADERAMAAVREAERGGVA